MQKRHCPKQQSSKAQRIAGVISGCAEVKLLICLSGQLEPLSGTSQTLRRQRGCLLFGGIQLTWPLDRMPAMEAASDGFSATMSTVTGAMLAV